jgi:hypothetical protein
MSPPTAVEPPSVVDTQIATLFGPLSINGIPSRRAKAPKLNGGLAAVTSSDMFKSPVSLGTVFLLLFSCSLSSGPWEAKCKEMGS